MAGGPPPHVIPGRGVRLGVPPPQAERYGQVSPTPCHPGQRGTAGCPPTPGRGVPLSSPSPGSPTLGSPGSVTAGVLWEMSPQTRHVTPYMGLGSAGGSGKGGGLTGRWVRRVGVVQGGRCTGWCMHRAVGARGGGCTGWWVSWAAGQGTAGTNMVGLSRANHPKMGHGVAQEPRQSWSQEGSG